MHKRDRRKKTRCQGREARDSGRSTVQGGLFDSITEARVEANIARSNMLKWVDANPDVFAWMLNRAKARAALGRRVSVSLLVEEARDNGIGVKDGETFAISNTIQAALARYIVELAPEIRPHIELRRSKADEAFDFGKGDQQ